MIIASLDLAIIAANIGTSLIVDNAVSFPPLNNNVTQALNDFHRHWQDEKGGDPQAEVAALALRDFLVALNPEIIVVDGPQGFARPGRTMRRAEAILRTSGRTGADFALPVGGFSWPGIARLGIRLFDALAEAGYPRLDAPQFPHGRCVVEMFPDACWHSFGLDQETLANLQRLQVGLQLTWNGNPNVHQLDAAVGAMTVIVAKQGHGVFVGHPFLLSGGKPTEGYILIPNPGRQWTSQPNRLTLTECDGHVQDATAKAQGKIGPADIPALTELFRDNERDVLRLAAAEAVGKLGPEAIPVLTALLQDENWGVQRRSVEALGKIGAAAIPALTVVLQDNHRQLQEAAAAALGRIGPVAIPALTVLLRDNEDYVRTAAAAAMGEIGLAAKPAVIELFQDENSDVQEAAANALVKIGPAAIPVLLEVVQDKEPTDSIWLQAVRALHKMGLAAIPALMELIQHEEGKVSLVAGSMLGQSGLQAEATIPTLVELLRNKAWRVQSAAVHALSEMGVAAKAAVPSITALLQNGRPDVRRTAVKALVMIAPDADGLIPAITDLLSSASDQITQETAVGILGRIGPTAIPTLLELLSNKVGLVRETAVHTLAEMAPEDGATILAITELSRDNETSVRSAVAYALGRLGPAAKASLPVLRELCGDDELRVQAAAIVAIARLCPEGLDEAISIFTKWLKHEDYHVRWEAAATLGSMGHEAKAAMPVLLKALRDTDEHVRNAAALALSNVYEEEK